MKLWVSKSSRKGEDELVTNEVTVKNIEETLRDYDNQIEKTPEDTRLYFVKAELLAKDRRYNESITSLDKVVELDPDNKRVWHIKAHTLHNLGRYQEAVNCYNKILEFVDDDVKVLQLKGEALIKLEQYDEAIDCFDTVIFLDPDFTKARLGRGNALTKFHSLALENDPKSPNEGGKAELEEALELFSKIIDLYPGLEKAWYGKGHVFYCLGRYEEAITCYDKCFEINPDYIKARYYAGKVLEKLGNEVEAWQAFETVVDKAPNNRIMEDSENWSARAYSFNELGYYDKALKCFNEILTRYPGNHYVLEGKGITLEKLSRKDEALQSYKEAIELCSARVSNWYNIGNLLANEGDYDGAIEYYNEAVQRATGFEEAWFRIGQLFKKQNNPTKAEECFSWILNVNPNNKKAQKALSSLVEGGGKKPSQDYNIQGKDQDKVQNKGHHKLLRKRDKISDKTKQENPPDESLRTEISPRKELSEDELSSSLDGFDPQETEIEKRVLTLEELSSSLEDYDTQETNIEEKTPADLLDEFTEYLYILQNPSDPETVHQEALDDDDINSCNVEIDIEDYASSEYLLTKGREYVRKKEFKTALSYYNKALELDPENGAAWGAKGEILLEMGKTDDANVCFKNSMSSMLKPAMQELDDEATSTKTTSNVMEDLTASSVEDLNTEPDDVEESSFECPKCAFRVDLENKTCSGCGMKFPEEEFKNRNDDISNELILFRRLRAILTRDKPFFIHLDNANGRLRFLEKRIDQLTGKDDYVLVWADIEKIGWDLSLDQGALPPPDFN